MTDEELLLALAAAAQALQDAQAGIRAAHDAIEANLDVLDQIRSALADPD